MFWAGWMITMVNPMVGRSVAPLRAPGLPSIASMASGPDVDGLSEEQRAVRSCHRNWDFDQESFEGMD